MTDHSNPYIESTTVLSDNIMKSVCNSVYIMQYNDGNYTYRHAYTLDYMTR